MKLLSLLLIVTACGPDQTINPLTDDELDELKLFEVLGSGHQLRISKEDEPGETLWLCLTIVEKESQKLLSNQKIHFYHTSLEGEYEPKIASDQTTARLNGAAQTDSLGRIFVKTILPGSYGSGENNRHIHSTVFNARPEAYDIHFSQYTSFMGKRFSKGSDQHFLADLKRHSEGHLVTFLTMEVKRPNSK